MKINIHTKNIELTKSIRDYVNEKVSAVGKLISDSDTTALADVEVGKTTRHHQRGEVFRAEINLRVKGDLLRAEATTEDLYSAVDKVKDGMLRELRKRKTKKESFFKRGAIRVKNMLRGKWGSEEE